MYNLVRLLTKANPKDVPFVTLSLCPHLLFLQSIDQPFIYSTLISSYDISLLLKWIVLSNARQSRMLFQIFFWAARHRTTFYHSTGPPSGKSFPLKTASSRPQVCAVFLERSSPPPSDFHSHSLTNLIVNHTQQAIFFAEQLSPLVILGGFIYEKYSSSGSPTASFDKVNKMAREDDGLCPLLSGLQSKAAHSAFYNSLFAIGIIPRMIDVRVTSFDIFA